MLTPQRLRLACDYGAESPLWAMADDGAMVALDELPLRDDTRERLASWAARWQELAEPGVVSDAPPANPDALAAFEAEGATLVHELRSELGAGWSIESEYDRGPR
jgi:hypothetical protein